ncbi:MAG TPA: PAS domain S-box protein [Acidobacteriaceae bacterium]|nr:PAS domain S-box protein [Acidobacteriaceae bacterium]
MIEERSEADSANDGALPAGARRVYAAGEMAECIREFAWDRTPVGAMEGWSDSFLCTVNLMLESQFATVLLWGPELVVMYNDAYQPLMAEKHPWGLGRGAEACWSEAWHIIGPLFGAVLGRGERFYFENNLVPVIRQGILKDVYWTYSYSPVRDVDGGVCGVLVVCHDVTEKLAAERERDAMAARLKNVLESTTDGLATLDKEWRYTYLNEQGARMVGRRPEDLVGRSLWEVFPEAVESEFGRQYRSAVETGKPRHFDAYYPEPLNVWLECHCYPTEHGLSVYFRDVTEQKVTEKELREREERFRVLAESVPQMIWMSNEVGETIYANRRGAEYLGVEEAELMRFGWTRFIHPDDIEKTGTVWKRCFDTGEPYVDEFRMRRKDGMYRHFLARAAPIKNQAGVVERWIGSTTDIHDQKLAEAALRKSEKLATAGRLAASIAHEINNPLAGVTNALYLALQDESLGEETRSYLNTAEQELRRVSHMTTQTLQFHKQANLPARVDISEVVGSVLELFRGRLATKNIVVHAECERGAFATCFGDEIRQVVANLVGNAMDAMPEGGRLRVRVRGARGWAKGWVEGVKIAIADTGSGIPAEVVEHIFEPFVTTKQATGIGLGLWVSDEIVRKHGGWIRVRSLSEGRVSGTAFAIFIPAEARAEAG